jgi:hypothetical protein
MSRLALALLLGGFFFMTPSFIQADSLDSPQREAEQNQRQRERERQQRQRQRGRQDDCALNQQNQECVQDKV